MANAFGAIFDLGPAIQQTKKALSLSNNLYLDMYNWRPWVELELRHLLNPFNLEGCVDEDEELSIQMGNLGFPTESLEAAKLVMRNQLTEMIRQGLGPVRDHHEYEVTFLDVDIAGAVYNLQIVDHGDKRALEAERRLKEEAMFAESGGYVPERMRSAYQY